MVAGSTTRSSADAGLRTASEVPRWLSIFAKVLAIATYCVVVAGGAVTSTDSGLADVHWPTFEGNLLPSPKSMLEDRGLFLEHGHRLIAGTVVVSTWVLAFCLWRFGERRKWVRRLAAAAAVAGVVPALFGGLTVRYELPAILSITHVAAAMVFLGLNTTLALILAKSWNDAGPAGMQSKDASWLAAMAVSILAATYVQIILGAVPRHTGGSNAIPHILWAFVVFTLVFLMTARVFSRHARAQAILPPTLALAILAFLQFFLGFTTYVTRPGDGGETASAFAQVTASVHQAAGALTLVAALVLTLRVLRLRNLLGAEAEEAR